MTLTTMQYLMAVGHGQVLASTFPSLEKTLYMLLIHEILIESEFSLNCSHHIRFAPLS